MGGACNYILPSRPALVVPGFDTSPFQQLLDNRWKLLEWYRESLQIALLPVSLKDCRLLEQEGPPWVDFPATRQPTISLACFAVGPFLTEDELAETETLVKAFQVGKGKELQEKLVERSKATKNWVNAA